MLTAKRRRLLTRQLLRDPWCVAAWKAAAYDSANALLFDLGPKGNHPLLLGAGANAPLHLPWTGRTHMWFPGAGLGTNYLWLADAAALKILGDIDIIVCVVLPDYTPGTTQTLMGKWAGAGARSYALNLNTDGTLQIIISVDGTASISGGQASAATGVTDGTGTWLRGTMDADDGAGNRVAKFYKSSDSPATALGSISWTQIGTTQTTVGTTTIFDGTAIVAVGAHTNGTAGLHEGSYHRAAIRDGYDGAGTVQLDIDFNDAVGSPSTFTERSANAATVTITRSATGRKSAVVDQTMALFGTDDYCECADNDLLDFGPTDPFSAVMFLRRHGSSAVQTFIAKKTGIGAEVGWWVRSGSGDGRDFVSNIADGTASVGAGAVGASFVGVLGCIAMVRNVNADVLQSTLKLAPGTAAADTTTTTLANSEVVRIARLSGAGTNYGDFEFFGAAVFREVLTNQDLSRFAIEQRWAA